MLQLLLIIFSMLTMKSSTIPPNPIRLDKWLWAARFFKTRALARKAVEGGKVHYNNERIKPSKIVHYGAKLKIRQGFVEKEVIVMGLTDKRGDATKALTLYSETPESLEKRALETQKQKQSAVFQAPQTKPDKKQRRQLRELKRQNEEHHD